MVQLKRLIWKLMGRFDDWVEDRDEVIANLPDNPWTYPCCGIHVKASDFFCWGNHLTILESNKTQLDRLSARVQ